jgi:hypothetical protein
MPHNGFPAPFVKMSENTLDFNKMLWFQDIWRDREERAYPELFGKLPDSLIPLRAEKLRSILGPGVTIDNNWLHHAVVEVAPNQQHADWLYVTTGMSQPWKIDDPGKLDRNGYSGQGFEMVLRTHARAGWAVDVLHALMAYQLGVYHEIKRGKLFEYYDWMPLNGPISPNHPDTEVRGMFISRPQDFPARFELRSGQVDLLQIVGITGPELAYGLSLGMGRLEKLLFAQGAAPTTDPARSTIELPQTFGLPPQIATRF